MNFLCDWKIRETLLLLKYITYLLYIKLKIYFYIKIYYLFEGINFNILGL